jgi:hypothetical protein
VEVVEGAAYFRLISVAVKVSLVLLKEDYFVVKVEGFLGSAVLAVKMNFLLTVE